MGRIALRYIRTWCRYQGYILKKSFYHYNIRAGSMSKSQDERLFSNTYYLYKGLEKVFIGYGELTYQLLRHYIFNIEKHM